MRVSLSQTFTPLSFYIFGVLRAKKNCKPLSGPLYCTLYTVQPKLFHKGIYSHKKSHDTVPFSS